MRLPQLTFGKVLGGTAVLLVLTTGAAYAHGPVTSADIVNGTIRSIDIGSGEVKSGDIGNSTIRSADIFNGGVKSADVATDTLTAADLASNSVGQLEIQTDGVAATEISDNSIDSGEIQDFSLSNLDINVFSAQVNADGTLASASNPGTTSVRVGAVGNGTYQVDFARVISSCTFVASLGSSGTAGALGEVSVADRSGNSEAVFVETNTSAGASADRPFQLVVVC
jgi:hypothetical protein